MVISPPPPPPPPASPASSASGRRLYRAPAGERSVGGVARGLADYLGVASGVVRVAFVILAFVGGLGILIYLVGLLVMPERPLHVPAAPPSANRTVDAAPAILGGTLIAIAITILFNDVWFWSGSGFWGVVLIVAGVMLFRRAQESPAPSASLPKRNDPPAPGYRGPGGTPPPVPAPDPGLTPPHADRPDPSAGHTANGRSALGRLTVAVALVVTGAAIWLDQADVLALTGVQIGGAALVVLGMGLLVGTLFGRARWLLALAVVLAVPLLLAAAWRLPFDVSTGQRFISPDSIGEIAPRYSLGMGELSIDLSDTDFSGRMVDVEANLGVGELRITVPDDVEVEVETRVGAGEYDVLGQRAQGTDLRRRVARAADDAAAGTLRLDANVGLGSLTISSTASQSPATTATEDLR